MPIPLSSAFTRGSAVPLDEYSLRADITARNAIPTGARYEYMECVVASDGKRYRLEGGVANTDWIEVTGGSGAAAWGSITGTLSSQTDLQTALDTVLADAAAYTDATVSSPYNDRGNYDASGNVFPSTGGSGSAGAIKKNDQWRISVAGTLGGTAVVLNNTIRALVDTPGQTAGNWTIYTTNLAQLDLTQTWTKAQHLQQVALTSASGHIALNLALSNEFIHTLTETTILDNPTNAEPGTSFNIVFIQNATTAKALTLGSNYYTPDGFAPALSITLNAVNVLVGRVNTATHITVSLIKHGVV